MLFSATGHQIESFLEMHMGKLRRQKKPPDTHDDQVKSYYLLRNKVFLLNVGRVK